MSALEVSVGENVETVDNFCAFKHISKKTLHFQGHVIESMLTNDEHL